MSMPDTLWNAFSTVVKMNGKVVDLASVMVSQQAKIEELTARVIRLESALETALSNRISAATGRLRRNVKAM
jgi:hypothetical protein